MDFCVMCGAHPGDAACGDIGDLEILEAAAEIRALYERLVSLEEHGVPEPRKHVQTSGPRCLSCGNFTTYTRVAKHGLCMKCESEGCNFCMVQKRHYSEKGMTCPVCQKHGKREPNV